MGSVKKFNRDGAVDWVMNEIWHRGFESFSVKAMSEALGITRSSFYNAFESREALFLEAFDRYFKDSPHYKLAKFAESDSALKLLTQVFKETCLARTNDPNHRGCMAVNSVSNLVGVNNELGPIVENAVLASITGFENLLNHSMDQGELAKNTNTHNLALAIQNTLMGLNTMSKIVTSEQELWSATKTTLMALEVYRE
tara:strand:- start:940 stop:1533 length:594 start_codon:yes stop_codon:yes gene_type:complete